MVVTDENMIQARDALKPHRGELYVWLMNIKKYKFIR
jgi:hypothetical protein